MAKIATDNPEKLYFTYPNTVGVICVKVDDEVFVMPAVWQVPLSYSPMLFGVLVSPKRYTYQKLLTACDFSLNYFGYEYAQLITNLGSTTGNEVYKPSEFDLQVDQSHKISSPTLREAMVSLECKKQSRQIFGDHVLFAAEVCNVWWDDNLVHQGVLNLERAQPLLYTGNFVFTTIDKENIQQCSAYQS